MNALVSGAIAMASLVIALFFLRFWRTSGDRFFMYFSLSFLVQGGHRIGAAFASNDLHEEDPLHYLIRLLAYALILWAVLEKNWPRRKQLADAPDRQ
jgi:hypothetical protein